MEKKRNQTQNIWYDKHTCSLVAALDDLNGSKTISTVIRSNCWNKKNFWKFFLARLQNSHQNYLSWFKSWNPIKKRLKIQTEKMFSFHFDCRVSDDATTTCVFFQLRKFEIFKRFFSKKTFHPHQYHCGSINQWEEISLIFPSQSHIISFIFGICQSNQSAIQIWKEKKGFFFLSVKKSWKSTIIVVFQYMFSS